MYDWSRVSLVVPWQATLASGHLYMGSPGHGKFALLTPAELEACFILPVTMLRWKDDYLAED
ncbi:hypothetical protein [Yersinia enterocolitica]|uniref:hypothetical protein n=1 Tax=Yersinia enterocolitica TaxID=630 RepID=UPI00209EB179|nr:hypothetical protein [Yersinia enterocolitica]